MRSLLWACLAVALLAGSLQAQTTVELTSLEKTRGELSGAAVERGRAVLSSGPWAFLRTKDAWADVDVSLSCTILAPATQGKTKIWVGAQTRMTEGPRGVKVLPAPREHPVAGQGAG